MTDDNLDIEKVENETCSRSARGFSLDESRKQDGM